MSLVLRVAGTILAGVAFLLTLFGGQGHVALLCVTGGATAIGAGTLV